MMVKIITVSLAASSMAPRNWPQLMPWRQAKASVENAPSAPASVGVAQPKSIAVKISTTTIQIGAVGGRDCQRWRQEYPRIGRPRSGFILQRNTTIAQ